MSDVVAVHLNLQRQEDGEQELVDLIEATSCVGEGTEGQVLDDVVDSLACDRRFSRLCHGDVKDS